MISFVSPGHLPIVAATTLGISAKETDDAIGKFGTGLKYSIAGILRLGGEIKIFVGLDEYTFSTDPCEVRGKNFDLVVMNGERLGFTTALGKHWEPWQYFRELGSNTLDEKGEWFHEERAPSEDTTVIQVSCGVIEDSEAKEGVFLNRNRKVLAKSSWGVVYTGESEYYYYRGIRAGKLPAKSPITFNATAGSLSEDRLLDWHDACQSMTMCFSNPTMFEPHFVLTVAAAKEGSFFSENLNQYILKNYQSPEVFDLLCKNKKLLQNKAVREAVYAYQDRKDSENKTWKPVQISKVQEGLIDYARQVCEHLEVDPIPADKINFSAEMPHNMLANANILTGEVWFSTKIFAMGRDIVVTTYLEEAIHASTGLSDYSRGLQDLLLQLAVTQAQRNMEKEE